MSSIQTLQIEGKKFVLIRESEYRRLTKRADSETPRLPAKSSDGTYPATQAMRAMMARKIIAARNAIRMSQSALAQKARIPVEVLSLLEKGKQTPDLATMIKINKALDRAGSPR